MKRILLSCILLLTIAVASFAQSTPPLDVATPVSKTEYVAKVNALNAALTASNTALAETIFGQVNTMVNDEMKVMRYKLRDASSEAERTTYREVIKNQRMYFSGAMNAKQSGMLPNRAALIEALNNFGSTFE